MNIKDLYNRIVKTLQERKNMRMVFIIFFSFVVAVPGSILGGSGAMRSVDFMFEDSVYQKATEDASPIVVVPVTSANAKLFNSDSLNVETLAIVLDNLNSDPANRPAAIGITNSLRSKGNAIADKHLMRSLQAGNVVLGNVIDTKNKIVIGDESIAEEPFYFTKHEDPIMRFNKVCRSGYTNVFSDVDGIVRNYLWNASASGEEVESFAEAVYDTYCDSIGISDDDRFEPEYSKDGFTMIPFTKNPGDFDTLPIEKLTNGQFKYVDPAQYAGRIVIIGTADSAFSAGYLTAISREKYMYGCDIQANVIDNLINNRSLMQYPINKQLNILTLVTWGMALLIFNFDFIYSFAYACVSLFAAFKISAMLWQSGISIHPLYYLATMIVAVFVSALLQFERIRIKQISANNVLSRYMDKNVRQAVLERINKGDEHTIQGKKRKVAVLFADIRNFTAISEELGPENIVNMLNDFLSTAERCVHAHGGTVDKFIGDCVMAFWEDSEEDGSIIPQACRAALDIVETIHGKEDSYFAKYNREITFGIGVDYGLAIVGDIGSDTRKDYTLVGDAVNLASRLESNAPKGMILVSQSIYDAIKDFAECEDFGHELRVKGFAQTLNAFILHSIQSNEGNDIKPVSPYLFPTDEAYVFYTFGTRGSFPVTGRRYAEFGGSTTCFVLKRGTHAVIFDCGTGLFEAQSVLKDCTRIDVVLSHMHYDHCIGLLSWYTVFPEAAELNFYGNFEAWFGGDSIKELFKPPFWPIDYTFGDREMIHDIKEYGNVLRFDDDITVEFFESPHPNGAMITSAQVGKKRLCIMVDCELSSGLPFEKIKGADVLVYDGMYDDSEYAGKEGWGHSTWQQAVELAKRAEVGHLIIAHHDPNCWDSELLNREKAARKIFPNTEFARSNGKLVFWGEDWQH